MKKILALLALFAFIAPSYAQVNGAGGGIVTQTLLGRPGLLTGSFTPVGTAGAWAVGQAIGPTGAGLAVFTLSTGLPSGTWITPVRIGAALPVSTYSASGNVTFQLFSDTPSATITDAAIPTLTTSDGTVIRGNVTGGNQLPTGDTSMIYWAGGLTGPLQVNASGNVYFVMLVNATITTTTPGLLKWFFYYTY